MKDKVFFPSIVLTMVFLIVFMFICIKTQASMTKELSARLEKMQAEIIRIQQEPTQESIQKSIQKSIQESIQKSTQESIQESKLSVLKESEKLKAEIAVMRNEIRELKKDLEKTKSEAASNVSKKRKR